MKTAITLLDSYKLGHIHQYPDNTTKVYSNFTPRASKIDGVDKVVFVGLQYFLERYLGQEFDKFFDSDFDDVVDSYQRRLDTYLGPNTVGTDHIQDLYNLGYLPLEFKALPEGTRVPLRIPMLTVENTHPNFAWLVNYLETLMSSILWLPCTSATTAHHFRELLEFHANKTGSPIEFVDWQGHDFSFRGMAGPEAASMSGFGHLTSFTGTDTIPAVEFVEDYYGDGLDPNYLIGASVPATEHSVMCAGGELSEKETFERIIKLYPSGIVSVVSDTWDLWKVLTNILPELKEDILARDGKLVVRPDCYDDQTQLLTNSGWKFFSDLTEDDLVAQVLPDNTYEFVKPTNHVNEAYSGDMVEFKDAKGKVDLLVTPNHRMLWRNSNTKADTVRTAEDTKLNHLWKMYRSASSSSKEHTFTALDKFRIAFQADGSYPSNVTKTATSGERCYRFNFAKDRKVERLEKICADGGFRIKVSEEKARVGQKTVYVWLPAEQEILKDFSWVNTSNLCGEWSREFIEELSYWDATRRSDSRFKFDTCAPEVVEVVELVSLSAGYGCLVTQKSDDRKDHFSDVYTAHIMKDNLIGGQAITKKTIQYNGTIHCVTVPTGMLVIKRGRATAVCGNSGNPADIVCGMNTSKKAVLVEGPANKGVIELLWDEFGGTVNEAGYKVLDPHVGCLYGDAITYERAEEILTRLESKGFASCNMVFGLGSFTYQYKTRDTFGFAMKATWAEVDGQGIALFKDPVTDDGVKKSAVGRLAVLRNNEGELYLYDRAPEGVEKISLLETVWKDGKFTKTYTIEDIRNTVKNS